MCLNVIRFAICVYIQMGGAQLRAFGCKYVHSDNTAAVSLMSTQRYEVVCIADLFHFELNYSTEVFQPTVAIG